jgi:hypothetical protein
LQVDHERLASVVVGEEDGMPAGNDLQGVDAIDRLIVIEASWDIVQCPEA